jgi:hypothetical protein
MKTAVEIKTTVNRNTKEMISNRNTNSTSTDPVTARGQNINKVDSETEYTIAASKILIPANIITQELIKANFNINKMKI